MRDAKYRRLVDALSSDIQNGTLRPGSKLSPHRKYADENGVSLATATRVYRELAAQGLVVGEKGRGVFVRDQGIPLTLGVEQRADEGLVDLVFNMPSSAADLDFLRASLKKAAIGGDLDAMLRYQPHAGRPHERAIVARHLSDRVGLIDPENLLLVSGAQHGLSLIVLGLLKRGDAVAADELTYTGFKSIASLQGVRLVAVALQNGNMDPDDLDRVCTQENIRAIYTMPTVHNPLGSVMDSTTRQSIAEVARKHDLVVIEDATYAFLETDYFDSLVQIIPERTFYVSGFSKSIGTGFRLGYVVAPDRYIDTLVSIIRATTWNVPALISGLVVGWIEDGTLNVIEEIRRQSGNLRQTLLRKHLWNTKIVSHSNASFAWLPLTNGIRAETVIKRLLERGYAVSGATAFSVSDTAPQAIRIAFGGMDELTLRDALISIRKEMNGIP